MSFKKKYYNKRPTQVRCSYGIACCRYNAKIARLEILMVRKRYTYYFVEFILGHYVPTDDEKLLYLFNRLSNDEKIIIESMDFERMWIHVFGSIPSINNDGYNRFIKGRRKFILAFLDSDSCFGKNRLIILLNNSTGQDCMWEIPKGKCNPGETELEAAIRECTEETNLTIDSYYLTNDQLTMEYSNEHVKYNNTYFIAVANKSACVDRFHRSLSSRPHINFESRRQTSEIVDVKWMGLDELKFLDQSNRFYTLVNNCFKILRTNYRLPKLAELSLIK